MKRKTLWITVIFFPFILFFLMSFKTIKEIYVYISLNQKAIAIIQDFEIKEDKRHRCQATLCYTFLVKNKMYKNKSLHKKSFLNYLNANDYLDNLTKTNFRIWYNKKNPYISSCEKTFPVKHCIYLIIILLVSIYFLILKYYVYSFEKND